MTHDFVGWTPPPGAVVDPPVHPQTLVNVFWSDGTEPHYDHKAGDLNWSSVGDGPRVVAYAVVQEYKPEPVLREWWAFGAHPDYLIVRAHKPTAHWAHVIHVREVPDPSREVVAWAVMNERGDAKHLFFDEVAARATLKARSGGTVVRLSGVMPNE